MIKTKSIGTIIVAALLGLLTVFLTVSKKTKKPQSGKKESSLVI